MKTVVDAESAGSHGARVRWKSRARSRAAGNWAKPRVVVLMALTLLVGAILAGCGLEPAGSYVPAAGPGTIQRIPGLPKDAHVSVTSKNYTEQLILGKIAVLAAQAAGFTVSDLSNVPGSQPVRKLMLSGRSDIMWEYLGTGWITNLGHDTGIPNKDEQWKAVHDADLKNGLTWGKTAPLNNTYALAYRSSASDELHGITKLSQLGELPVKDRTLCLEAEFNSRQDGINPMLAKYGLKRGAPDGVPESNIGLYDTGAVYQATADGDCNFGEVFTTDGRIDALHLKVLEDDRKFFPAYNVAPVFKTQTLEKYPQLAAVFEQVTPLITDETMRTLNGKVDLDGEDPADVAYDWMISQGLITKK